MRTADVEGLAEFYRLMFGLRVVRKDLPRSIWLGIGGDAVLMIEHRQPLEPVPPPGSMELLTFRVDEAAKALVRKHASDLGCYDGETEFTVYVRDPDERRIGASTYDLENPPR
jgi:hypothetical protein